MSLYCIGDLHGRYDLFTMALEKIHFNYKNDKLFLLGDIINVNSGATKIFKHIMKYPDSFELILGNHEIHYINMIQDYNTFMLNNELKLKVKNVAKYYFKAYGLVSALVNKKIDDGNIQSIRDSEEMIEWVNISKKRSFLLDAIIDLIKFLDYDKIKFKAIESVLLGTNGIFKTKQFLNEILELNTEEYTDITKYILSKKRENKFTYKNKEFWLIHSFYTRYLNHIPNLDTENHYILFGHNPVPQIHRNLSEQNFEFNYREILSYVDRFDNYYFNLDMGDNVTSILRLDDFEEFYVMKYKKEPKSDIILPPNESAKLRKVGYKMVNSSLPVLKKGFSFITYKNYCMEYLIGVNKYRKKIYYKRVDYMDYTGSEVIDNWYYNQSIEEITEKVRSDDISNKNSEDSVRIEELLRRIPK